MTRPPRLKECIDCAQMWDAATAPLDVRCPRCRILQLQRVDIQQHLDALIVTERGSRIAQVALAAAHTAASSHPAEAGAPGLRLAIHRVAKGRDDNERTLQIRLVRLAGAALLWAAEITEAIR